MNITYPCRARITNLRSCWRDSTHFLGEEVEVLKQLPTYPTDDPDFYPAYEVEVRPGTIYTMCIDFEPIPDEDAGSKLESSEPPHTVIPSRQFRTEFELRLTDELARAAKDQRLRMRNGGVDFHDYVQRRVARAWDAAVKEVLK